MSEDTALLNYAQLTNAALRRIADQLDRWIAQSISGSWSTHQVEPMRRLSSQIRESLVLGEPERILAERP